ncbi:hypothetical protein L1049_019602 [Liquidambar formosana]|uniref:Zinc finger PHD-type domain-containing protein n=1 Tax=Liquidambar formosana TaxID=63359 RepID=A0AAP0X9B8_LIQFO
MSGTKVVLTYKRKRSSLKPHLVHGGGWPHSSSERSTDNPLTITDKHEESIGQFTSEDQKRDSGICLECVVCGVGGNLLHCGSCLQPYHNQCLGASVKRMPRGKRLCLSCIGRQDSSASQPIRESSRLKAKKNIEGSDMRQMTLRSHKLILMKSPSEGASEEKRGFFSTGLSSERKSSNIEIASCSYMNSGSPCNDGRTERSVASQSVVMDTKKSLEFVGTKTSSEINCSSRCTGASVLKTSNLESTDSLSKDKCIDICRDALLQTKLTTPLITFSRRFKRKKDADGIDTQSKLLVEGKYNSLVTKLGNSGYGTTFSA